ncbi:MAG: N-acetylglutamate kinase [Bryobacterales bacterium]|nr:N-acetylglutamate kinase [Bryobacterales bacterium]
MKLLIKIGGTLLDTAAMRDALALQIARLLADGHRCFVVHGGGKQMTRFLEERGIQSRFVNGLRVTTPETMDAVLKVLAGSVNQELVAALIRSGVRAVGLTGLDGGTVQAEQMDPELGAVGRVTGSDPELMTLLTGNGYLPVVACLAGDREGHFYNVNGDQMAVACAAAIRADRLIFLTDVAGVLDGAGKRLESLSVAGAADLIASGVAKGGMQAKLDAATSALRQGIGKVYIAPGMEDAVLVRVIAGESIGTRIGLEIEAATV